MMLTMHGLPNKIKYNEIKTLIREKCNLTDFILGNLGVDEDKSKHIRIGVASEAEGDIIMKYLDGCRYSGQVLRIVPIGKIPPNETPKVKVSNDNTYQWNNQQPEMDYVNPLNPGQGGWPIQANQQWSNTQTIPQQIPVQNNYEIIRPIVAQPNFYQERFPQNRGQQEIFSHNVPSNLIEPPRGTQPHAPVTIITDQQQNRQPIQGGRYPNQGFNPEKPQTMSKQGFQGSSHIGPQPTQPGEAQFHSQQWSSHGTQDTSRFQKQNSPHFEKSSNKIMHPDKRQIVPHNQERNVELHYEKGERRFSPPRDQKDSNHGRRVSPPGHRVSPSGHRILPSGRRISPPPRNSQFKNRISPPGRRISPPGRRISPPGLRISPPGRQISPPGRRISPQGRRFSPQRQIHSVRQISPTGRQNLEHGGQNQPGRRFSPPGRQVSPSGRHFVQSDRQNFHLGSKISPSGRRNSPPPRQMAPSGRPVSPPGRRMSPSGRRFSPSGRGISPPGRRISPPRRQYSPSGRRISPRGQRISPSGRRMSPMGRKHSPSGRRITPERSFLPPGRRVSPGPGVIPSARRISPSGRRMSPGNRTSPERRVSPGHRIAPMNKGPQGDRHMQQKLSPGKPAIIRNMSPARHISPNQRPSSRSFDRYSPSRKPMDYIQIGPKEVRPAYASMTQAQNQPMYSGGYPPEGRETEQYPPDPRKGDQRPNWQEREKPYQPPVKPVEDRRDIPGVSKYDSRRGGDYPRPVLNQPENKALSPGRVSRSPNRRDRSPIRDRYRRHSPSPRSPRRSWALEKRRSPSDIEPPPPPSWPERQENVYKSNRQHDEENIKKPVWIKIEARQKQEDNPTFFRKEDRHSYDREDKKYFGNPSRPQWDSHHQPQQGEELRDRSPLRARSSDKYSPNQNESKSPREDFDMKRRNEFQQHSPRYQEPRVEQFQNREKTKKDFDEFRHKRDDYHQSFNSREESLYLGQENLDREIEDVYSRAAELTRKTEEYQRKRNSKIRFTIRDQRSPEDNDFKKLKEGPFKKDFYEASHSKFDKNPRQMGEMVSSDLPPAIQYKRDKAVDDLTRKILMKFAQKFKGKVRHNVEEQLKILIEDMIFEMFGDKDVSFIEIVIKFEEKHGVKGMEKIFDKVLSKFPIEIRLLKQPAPDVSTSPVPISRSGSPLSMRGAKVFKPKFIREEPMRNPIAMKRTMPMYMREPAKRPMIYEPALTKAPTKKILPMKKNAPIKDMKKVLPSNNSTAIMAGKPVLNKEINKKVTETKPPAGGETSVKKAPVKSKTEVLKNIPSISKEAVEQAVVKEQKNDAEDKPSKEYQELSPLLTSALNSELEDIMIKVWQELPDEPLSVAEEHVVEKIRNEAGDDLRNVIGLNITKRLLDIHNNLYAKLLFKMRPERGALGHFIKKYKLKTFKRISDVSPIFAAQFSNYEDYDRVCKDGVVYCGKVRVNVKACYNFRTCPLNLRTSFLQHDKNTINNDNSGEKSNITVANKASKGIVLEEVKESDKTQDKSNKNNTSNVSDKTEAINETENARNIETKIDRSAEIEVETEPTQDKENYKNIDKVNEDKINNLQEMQVTQTNVNQQKDIEVNTGPTEDNEGNENDEKTSKGTVNEHLAIEDIEVLSMISEGIVLDECGSSDVE